MTRDMHGRALTPGVNVDPVDVAAGVKEAIRAGYATANDQMVVEYALMRHARGEEDGGQRAMLRHGIDLTSYYRILAAAVAAATPPS